ncbi:transglycosylase domain-containing protein [Vibrio sp. CDRSL-10 TSBA]
MKLLYLLLSLPYMLASCLLYVFSPKFRCLKREVTNKIIDLEHHFPAEYKDYLQLSEDHRSNVHFGVDQLSFFRVLYVYLIKGTKQGASTIEQQLVRTITGRYDLTLKRKLSEQLLAILISREFDKNQITSAYIQTAYLGGNIRGIFQLAKHLGLDVWRDSETLSVELAIRLKYPETISTYIFVVNKISEKKGAHPSTREQTANKANQWTLNAWSLVD